MRCADSGSMRDIVQIRVYSASDCAFSRPSNSSRRCSTVRLPSKGCPAIPRAYSSKFSRERGVKSVDSRSSSGQRRHYLGPFSTDRVTFAFCSGGGR